MAGVIENWQGYMVKAVASMAESGFLPEASFTELENLVETLPLEKETFNPEDRPVIAYFQEVVHSKVYGLSSLNGVPKKFAKDIRDCHRYALSLVAQIEADDQLLAIAKELEKIADEAAAKVA